MEHFDISAVARASADFRRVVWTGEHTQLVVMTVGPGEEIGLETHEGIDQVLAFVGGTATATVGDEERAVGAGDVVVVPGGTRHNVVNSGSEPLVLWTVYGPPEHADGTVHHTKAEADAAEESHHGR